MHAPAIDDDSMEVTPLHQEVITVAATGVRLAYEVTGDGEPVVLIAGCGMPSSAWHVSQVPAIAAAGFQVVTFANRGILPTAAPSGRYAVADMAADVAGLIEGLHLGPCRIAGVSLGGFVAQELAIRRPDLVRAVVLIASAGRTTSFLRVKTWAERDFLTRLRDASSYELVDTLLFSLCPFELQNDDARVDRWIQLLRGQGRVWSHPDARLAQYSATWDWILDAGGSQRRADVTMPCLVMAFEHDLYFPPRVGREAAQAMPHGEFVEIAAAAHAGWFERAEAVNAAILGFFART